MSASLHNHKIVQADSKFSPDVRYTPQSSWWLIPVTDRILLIRLKYEKSAFGKVCRGNSIGHGEMKKTQNLENRAAWDSYGLPKIIGNFIIEKIAYWLFTAPYLNYSKMPRC